jgi:hypothetical protein
VDLLGGHVRGRALPHAHRVDAVAEPAGGIEPQVGGRIAELAAALVAVHDLAADEPGIAQQVGRLPDVPRRQRPADRTG